jgi:hypothetical protein
MSAQAQTLELTLSASSVTFASADPDTTPQIAAAELRVTYRIRDNDGGGWRISLLAGSDLTAGAASIPIGLVTWTATPAPPFQNGIMSRTIEQTLASGSGNVTGFRTGSVVFSLENRWTHNPGIYTTSVAFTLVAP